MIHYFLVRTIVTAVVANILVDCLTKEIARKKLKKHLPDAIGAIVKDIVQSGKVKRVTWEDLTSDKQVVIEANEVDDAIRKGTIIYI